MRNFSFALLAYLKIVFLLFITTFFANAQSFSDTTINYSLPKMYKLHNGQVGLSWLEMDSKGVNHLCWSVSSDLGNTFSKKQDIYASETLRGSRLMKPNVIQKRK